MSYYKLISSMLKATISSLLTGLYAVYKAESNANDSKGTNNGTAQGGLTYSAGKSGNAFVGNGTNAYVQLPVNSFKPTSSDFSISVWVNFAGTGGDVQTIFSILTYLVKSYGVFCYYYNSVIYFQISNATTDTLLTYTSNLFSSWKHLTFTRTGGTRSRIYLNGTLVASNTSIQNPSYPLNVYPSILGADYGGSISNQYFASNGTKIDEVNIWNKELTATEVTELYNSGTGKFYPY